MINMMMMFFLSRIVLSFKIFLFFFHFRAGKCLMKLCCKLTWKKDFTNSDRVNGKLTSYSTFYSNWAFKVLFYYNPDSPNHTFMQAGVVFVPTVRALSNISTSTQTLMDASGTTGCSSWEATWSISWATAAPIEWCVFSPITKFGSVTFSQ